MIAENEETSAVNGYGVFRKDRILAVYANVKEIAHAIMQEILQTMNHDEVLLYIYNESGNFLIKHILLIKNVLTIKYPICMTNILFTSLVTVLLMP